MPVTRAVARAAALSPARLLALAVLASPVLASPLLVYPALASAQDLHLDRVMLSTGGVGYFEWSAEVEGDSHLSLNVPYDQVDDILKSLVVFDDKGGVGGIELPGREPLGQLFRELPFDQAALQSVGDLLNRLQGAEVTVSGSRSLTGRLLKAESETTTNGENITTSRTRITLITAAGLQQFILEEAEALKFTDPTLAASFTKALGAIAQSRARDSRKLDITTYGTGKRRVSVAYVVAAPLWKTAYRLTLPSDSHSTSARMQGWAVIENMSGQDWKDVELTLVSGNPVTFRQALYDSYYVDRPSVPVAVVGRILPEPDQGASPLAITEEAPLQKRSLAPAAGFAPMAAAPAPAPALAASGALAPPPDQAAPARPIEASEGQTQVLFRIKTPVTVGSGASLSVPMIDRDIPAGRVDLFSPGDDPDNPLAALDLKNDGDSGLPPGILTLYERAAEGVTYVGDARLATLPAGDSRLISYAVDQKVRIDRNDRSDDLLRSGRVDRGVLALTTTRRHVVTFKIAGAAREPRRLILDVPKLANYTVVEPASGVRETPQAWRLTVDLAAGETRSLQLVAEQPVDQRVALTDLDDGRIAYYANAASFDAATKAKLDRLAQLKRAAADRHQAVKDAEAKMAAIDGEQGRLRANLDAVPKDSDLYRRYLQKLDSQETDREKLQAARSDAQDQADRADKALADFIAGS